VEGELAVVSEVDVDAVIYLSSFLMQRPLFVGSKSNEELRSLVTMTEV
jgi:hypothetical protein